jgi:hypothetical protein
VKHHASAPLAATLAPELAADIVQRRISRERDQIARIEPRCGRN